MKDSSLRQLDQIVVDATEQLFGAHDLSLHRAESDASEVPSSVAASIGFTSENACGALVLVTSMSVVSRTFPMGVRHDENADRALSDWAGELANQLLGRVKNKLLSWGLDIQLTLPVVVVGKSLAHAASEPGLVRYYSFRLDEAWLTVVFQAAVREGFDLEEVRSLEAQTVAEGEMAIF